MGQATSSQHPAVVLRSHYLQLRALFAVAMIAVVGLTAAVVILATNDDAGTSAGSTQPLSAATQSAPGPRHDGGPEEGSADIAAAQPRLTPEQALREAARAPADRRRYDGGLEKGTSGTLGSRASSNAAPGIRYDGGPDEGTAAVTRRSAPATFDPNSIKQPPGQRYDGGPEEGTSGALSSSASSNAAPGTRYDGGPEEGTSGPGH
jgi:hypothetical protein